MAVYTVKLEDQTSAPAASAADAVRGLSAEFEGLQKQLAAVELAQREAFAKHAEANYKPIFGDATADIKKQQQAALAGHDASRDAAQGMKEQAEAAAQTSKWFQELTKSGNSAAEQVSALREKFVALAPAIGIALAVVTAIGAALWKLGSMAIAATQAKDRIREALGALAGGGAAKGAEVMAQIDDLSKSLPQTAGELWEWGRALEAAGVQADRLDQALRAVAAADALNPGGRGRQVALELLGRLQAMADSGQKIKVSPDLLNQMRQAGVSAKALAEELGVAPEKLATTTVAADKLSEAMQRALVKQGVGAIKSMGATWDVISAKFDEGIGDAFEDLGDLVHPFMEEIRSLASEFYKDSVGAKTLAGVVKSVLTPAFSFGTQAVRWLHVAFLTLEVYTLRARVALLPVSNVLGKIGVGSAAVNVALYLLKGTVITLTVVFGLLALAVALVALPFVLVGLAIYGVVKAVEYLVGVVGGAIDNLDNIGAAASRAGQNLITSLGNAIQSGAAWVVGLVQNLASSIIGAITGPLQIHSPSRVMQRIGGHITTGLAQGVEQGTPTVEAAAYGAGSAAAGGAAAGGAGGGRGGLHIDHVEINVNGAGKDWQSITEEAFEAFMERIALRVGA